MDDDESLEAFVDECEEAHRESLLIQKERSEHAFREGRYTTLDEIKRRHEL